MTEYCSVVWARNILSLTFDKDLSGISTDFWDTLLCTPFFDYVDPVCIIEGYTGIEFEVTLI